MFIALLLAAAVEAAAPATVESPPAAKPKKEKIICVYDEFVGSRMTRKICKTKAQWDEMRYNAHEVVDRGRLRASSKELSPLGGN